MFFPGIHHASKAQHLPLSCVSVNTLWGRLSDFHPQKWIMDSGAFSEIATHGRYREERSTAAYAKQIVRWRRCGRMLRAVQQDYMCEPEMLETAGGTVDSHQRKTIDRYDALVQHVPAVWVMPCLQGQVSADYAAHVRQWGARLSEGHWIGVGSVCKRKRDSDIREVIRAIHSVRPDLRLHGFGLKKTALQ